jgi:hypothetical protein
LNRGRGNSGGGHSPPYDWIPAPRFHEDMLRGNDPPEADLRRTGGLVVDSPQDEGYPTSNSLESPFGKAGVKMRRGSGELQGLVPAGVWGVPRSLFSSPKIEDPPQEEWGIKGVESEL